MSSYVYDQAWSDERRRLAALAMIYDPGTFRLLDQLGVTTGWHCLEVGAGEGSVARRLASTVGPTGRVLAVDLDPRFVEGIEGVDSLRHDILDGAPEPAAFDLVHARAVVEWIADRPTALASMVAALKPGGVLLVEDVDLFAIGAAYPPSEAFARTATAFHAFAGSGGAELHFGRELPARLLDAGLTDVGSDARTVWQRGGDPTTDFQRLTLAQLRGPLLASGVLSEDDAAEVETALDDPSVFFYAPLMVAAWGRRPG